MAMNNRERILALAVGAIVGVFAIQYVVNSVRKAIDAKQARIDALRSANEDKNMKITNGELARKRLAQLKPMSLPSSQEAALAQYGAWLVQIGQEVEMNSIDVTKPKGASRGAAAYSAYQLMLKGNCRVDKVIALLAKFYDKSWLHSIKLLKLDPNPADPNIMTVTLTCEAIALKNADATQSPPETPSGRLAKSEAEYLKSIGGRNPFSPPNNAPNFAGKNSDKLERGKEWSLKLEAKDPDPSQTVKFELVSPPIAGLKFDPSGKISWRPEANGEYELLVKATDSGLPASSVEQKIKLAVVDPTIPPPPPQPPAKFDIASQTEVSALLNGRGGAKAHIRSKLDGKTLEVRAGDNFEIGSVKAKVISLNIDDDYIELETDNRRWTIGMGTSLAEAFKKSQSD